MSDAEGNLKEYPRTPFRGPVRVWYSTNSRNKSNYVKYHYDRRCSGLERVPVEMLASETFEDAFVLGEDRDGRPCRMCTLERVLYTVMRPRARGNAGANPVFTMFTSQPCPTSPDISLRKYKWRESSASGKDRLRRISSTLGLPVVTTTCGPVSWGFLPQRGADIIASNLRTETRPEVRVSPTPEVVECAWALFDDHPPQLRPYDSSGAPDPWDLARALLE